MKFLLPAAGIMLIILFVLSSGCNYSTHVSYQNGNLSVSNESVITGCLPGHTNCSFSCADLQEDNFNCGSCGAICNEIGRTCRNGTCTCRPGYVTCNNTCADLQTDESNCGSCGTACPNNQFCTDGRCGCSVNAFNGVQMTNCNGKCVDTTLDSDNCGRCGNRCHAGAASCRMGICQSG